MSDNTHLYTFFFLFATEDDESGLDSFKDVTLFFDGKHATNLKMEPGSNKTQVYDEITFNPPVEATTIEFESKSVYHHNNNGLAEFIVWGEHQGL